MGERREKGAEAGTPGLVCVAPVGDRCGEGAIWDAAGGAVFWTDINRFLIHRLDAASGGVRSWFFDEPVVALSLTDRDGTMLVALGSRLILWQPENDRRTDQGFALDGWPRVRLNDGRADPAGRFWVGSMKNNVEPDGESSEAGDGEGTLFRVDAGGAAAVFREGLGIPNTLCWSPDGRFFYTGDTLHNVIRRYDYDAANGTISNETAFFKDFERGLPDGSAIDAEGFLWNCRWGGGCVVRIAPDGTVDRVIDMPALNVTTAVFGGADLTSLYITTARGDRPGDRLAGSLFRLDTAVRGLSENRFRIG
ncbi:MAG: SMP-30/gluconolactonase/LRE family protein [Rhizobiales bacterium]|nr:SMP-30/gluconolactonase/LRE family protein [Hyphomicrobiales bacterium]